MVAKTELQRAKLSGWRTGLANLLRKENHLWWASPRQIAKNALWAVGVNGFIALMVFVLLPYARQVDPGLNMESLPMGVDLLVKLGLLVLAFRTILLAQDEILGERQRGVTEWLLSRPVSRPAYVLSKLLAFGLGVLILLVGLYGALGYILLSLIVGEPFPLSPFLVGIAGLAVHSLFYLALTLMMGVLTTNRRLLLGVSQGVLLGGGLAINVPGTAVMLTPWALVNVLPVAVLGLPLPVSVWLPIGVTAILSVICVAVTLVMFDRLEF